MAAIEGDALRFHKTAEPAAREPAEVGVEEQRAFAVAQLDGDALVRDAAFAVERGLAVGVCVGGAEEAAVVHLIPFRGVRGEREDGGEGEMAE